MNAYIICMLYKTKLKKTFANNNLFPKNLNIYIHIFMNYECDGHCKGTTTFSHLNYFQNDKFSKFLV